MTDDRFARARAQAAAILAGNRAAVAQDAAKAQVKVFNPLRALDEDDIDDTAVAAGTEANPARKERAEAVDMDDE